MTQHLRADLTRLEKRLLRLGTRVEEATRNAITSLIDRNVALAEQVIDGDVAIDQEEVEIEEDCLKVLALHQPVATDLRFVAACLKINSDLERIGDLAVNIAKRACSLGRAEPFAAPDTLRTMTDAVLKMVRRSIDSFIQGDADLAIQVLAEDEAVDHMNRDTIHDLIDKMKLNASIVDSALRVLSVSKHLERIADHATNIAEDVVYMVRGEIIRHHPGLAEEIEA